MTSSGPAPASTPPGGPAASSARGRPLATTHASIEREAFALFTEHGFEATTFDMIAERLGVSRRTVTRYYASKNDIAWGHFDRTLAQFRELLDTTSPDLPLWQRVTAGVIAFNAFMGDDAANHPARAAVIFGSPTLLGHAQVRFVEWRQVISEFVAEHLDQSPTDSVPRMTGHLSLALSMSAYETWLDGHTANPEAPMADADSYADTLTATFEELRTFIGG